MMFFVSVITSVSFFLALLSFSLNGIVLLRKNKKWAKSIKPKDTDTWQNDFEDYRFTPHESF